MADVMVDSWGLDRVKMDRHRTRKPTSPGELPESLLKAS